MVVLPSEDRLNWPLVCNSLIVSGAAAALAVAGGTLAALWFAGCESRGRVFFLAASIVALVLPPFLVVNCWIELLGENGSWRHWLPVNIYTLGGTIWNLALLNWPIAFLFVTAAWRRVQAAHLEADPRLEGRFLLRWLLLPMARTALAQSAILTVVLALNNFAVPAILQVKVFPAEVWVLFNTTFNYKAAIMLSWPLVLAPLILVLCLRGGDNTWTWQSRPADARALRRQLGPAWHRGGAMTAVLLVGFSLGVPLYQLAGSKKTWIEFWPATMAGQFAITHSLEYATISAVLVIALALLTWRARLDSTLWLPFFIPGVLLGIALIWIFNRPGVNGIYQSGAIVILAYVIRYAALGWNIVARAIRAGDPSLYAMAKLEGAGFWQTLRHIQWPQASPQVGAAWYVTYLLCLWDVETLVLIVPPGGESLSLRIFNLLHYGHNSQVNALCLLLLALGLLPWLAWSGLRWAWLGWRSKWAACLLCCAFIPGLLAGCSVDGRKSAPVNSKFFSRVEIIGSRGAGVGELNKPRSVALDARDNLYVIDMTGRVQKFSPEGKFLMDWQMPQITKGKPKGMCRDKAGEIVLVEPHYSRVNFFSEEGKLAAQFGDKGTNFGQLGMPRAAVSNSKGQLYICEYTDSERVQYFTAHGEKCLGSWGHLGDKPGEFSRAEGLGIDAHDNIYVADSCNHRIQVFTPDGKFLRQYGHAGSGPGEFSYPYDIRIDSTGLQFVCEFGNSRIQILDSHDQTVEMLGGPGGGPGQFSNPWSIAFDSKGDLYVTDAMNNRVQKFIRK
ncbi:MAG TPA: 6-bladed beta-propeller [Verrucomicrobiae bacterium]|jgi:ABC-type Fe3+ transport system permease subunit/streptogramin lyase